MVANRISTVRDSGRRVALRDGQLAEEGTHQPLLQAGGIYYD